MSESPEMKDLLEKTRQVNRALQDMPSGSAPDFNRLARLLTDLASSNTYIVANDGKILGAAWANEYNCPVMSDQLKKGEVPSRYAEKLSGMRESVMNHTDNNLCAYDDHKPCNNSNKHVIFSPIIGTGERLGTLILARFGEPFSTKDLVLAEYLSTVVGLEILNERSRSVEEQARERLLVQMAMRALSFSEVECVKHIIADIESPDGGIVVASRVADRVGVTRSVIVNALRKLASAGIIESRSLGMKGTYIKIISRQFLKELGIER